MKKTIISIFIISISIGLGSCSDGEYEIFLSPNGRENATGAKTDPIANLNDALNLIKEKAGKIPITVYLFGGDYTLSEPLKFGIDVGGNKNAPIHWKALPGEKPVISGGVEIKNWDLEKDGSWSTPLPKTFSGTFRSLYINDNRATRARFPDKGYLKIDKSGKDKRSNFYCKNNDLPKLIDIAGLELVFLHDWSITRIGVKSID